MPTPRLSNAIVRVLYLCAHTSEYSLPLPPSMTIFQQQTVVHRVRNYNSETAVHIYISTVLSCHNHHHHPSVFIHVLSPSARSLLSLSSPTYSSLPLPIQNIHRRPILLPSNNNIIHRRENRYPAKHRDIPIHRLRRGFAIRRMKAEDEETE